jgi:zinc/manganese transport system permease protein
MLALSAGLALASGVAGLLLSFHTNVPAGPAIILVCGLAYFVSLLAAPGGLIAPRWPRHRHLSS